MSAIERRISSKEALRFVRFLVVGLSGTAVDFGLFTVLKLAGLPTLLANTLSFSAGVINNFVWNRRWTFPESRAQHWNRQLVQFAAVSVVGWAINSALLLLLEPVFAVGFGAWAFLPAKVIATGVVVFWNYIANRLWTFRNID